MDAFVKNFHIIFFAYAVMIGLEKYEIRDVELTQASNALEAAKKIAESTARDLKQVIQFKADLTKSKRRVQEVVENIERIQKQLPSQIIDADVNDRLVEFSNALKMIDPSPAPKEEVNHNFYISKEFSFGAKGTFLQFLVFFEQLEKLAKKGRILNVKNVLIKKAKDADPRSRFKILELEATVEAYKYNNNFNPEDLSNAKKE